MYFVKAVSNNRFPHTHIYNRFSAELIGPAKDLASSPKPCCKSELVWKMVGI